MPGHGLPTRNSVAYIPDARPVHLRSPPNTSRSADISEPRPSAAPVIAGQPQTPAAKVDHDDASAVVDQNENESEGPRRLHQRFWTDEDSTTLLVQRSRGLTHREIGQVSTYAIVPPEDYLNALSQSFVNIRSPNEGLPAQPRPEGL